MSSDQEAHIDPAPPEGFHEFPFRDGFASHVGPIFITMREGKAVLGFRVMPHHCNPAGICHGGMMMTVMDMAIGANVAVNAGVEVFTPTVNLTYDFIMPGRRGNWLESKFDWVHTTRRTGFANGYLMGPDGAVMRANGICKIPKKGDPRFQMAGERAFSIASKDV